MTVIFDEIRKKQNAVYKTKTLTRSLMIFDDEIMKLLFTAKVALPLPVSGARGRFVSTSYMTTTGLGSKDEAIYGPFSLS